MSLVYITCLLVSLCGLAVLDWRYRLVLWRYPKAALKALAVAVAFFALWDGFGIARDIFFPGTSRYTLDLLLAPGFPIEEVVFLTLLCYQALVFWEGIEIIRNARSAKL